MPLKRTHIMLPENLLAEIDTLAGQRGRSNFLADLLQQEIQRRKLLAVLREAKGCWKREHHPELKNGSEAFVERLRTENDERLNFLDNV